MTELDQELAPEALALIDEFGKAVVYTPARAAGYDTSNGQATGAAGDPKPIKAIVEYYNLQSSGQAFASGLVRAGDKKFTVAGLSFDVAPVIGCKIAMDGATYEIVNIKAVYTGELVALYELQGRKQ